MNKIKISRSAEDTEKIALELGKTLKAGDIVLYEGDLGAGKTTFTKGLARALGVDDVVTSPTFALVNEYSGKIPLFHFDVYRLADSDEFIEIGGEEYFYEKNGVSIIEWADIVEDILPEDTKYIYIEYGADENERIYRCTF